LADFKAKEGFQALFMRHDLMFGSLGGTAFELGWLIINKI
jgi:hypothetical protein